MALVFVLGMLVLTVILVLAYFSRTLLHRQISSVSAASTKVRLITQAATGFIQDDIQHEIEAGSLEDPFSAATVRIMRPIRIEEPGINVPVAPSMAPQRVADQGIANILKVSRSGKAFFSSGPGYRTLATRTPSGPARASAISTLEPAVGGRFMPKDRWNLPRLMTDAELAAFTAPDWVYLDRAGNNPTNFSAQNLAELSSSASGNSAHVIGRFAYVIYDTGGLIDINSVGNALSDIENSRRGRLNQVSLRDGIGDQPLPDFPDFVAWRSAASSTDGSSTAGGGGLFDPKRSFLEVPAGEQAFVSRQDLIAYTARPGSPLPPGALPYLTTSSRDLNAPSYEPNGSRPKLPASPDADQMNPALLSIRFANETTLDRPGGAAVTVPAGTPVMPRRFPLTQLRLFGEENPDEDAMKYYFGLTKVDAHTWKYTAATPDGRIAKLSEVAALGREPNFFEVLQAVIYTGSLGQNAEDTYTHDKDRDRLQNLQLLQIGANIIDQYDSDDFPTGLRYPSGIPGDDLSVFGIENLPYLSQVGLVGYRPAYNRDLFQLWAVFDVWNPHQNSQTPPAGIDAFRIVPVSGKGSVTVSYYLAGNFGPSNPANYKAFYSNTPANGGCQFSSAPTPIIALNQNRPFSFPAAADYSEPTTLGTAPATNTDSAGVLIAEFSPGKAVPPLGERTEALQLSINALMDLEKPYKTVPANAGYTTTAMGKREYPPGTTFVDLDPAYWLQEGQLISGKYAVKAHNTCRLLKTGDPYGFELQAYDASKGQWVACQRIDGLFQQNAIANSPVDNDTRADFFVDTHHSESAALLEDEFYSWRSRGATVGMIKADPRTARFGLSGWNIIASAPASSGNDFLGLSVRDSTSAFTGALLNDRRWCVPNGVYSSGWGALPGVTPETRGLVGGFEMAPGLSRPVPFGLATNNPDSLNLSNPSRYPDPDGVIRPADAYFGGIPMARGQSAARPIILNRPFRSVGELGYVFRDIPWKTLDMFSRRSGDLGLLDAFSISETDGDLPVVAGSINLNTRQTSALAAVLKGSSKQLPGLNPAAPAAELSAAEAREIAQAIVAESTVRPFSDRGDLVARVLNKSGSDLLTGVTLKSAREAAVRTLAEIGTTRTWNFLIDLVAQTGRFTTSAKTGGDFLVQGEERIWIHLSIDRMTGEVLEARKEVVNE